MREDEARTQIIQRVVASRQLLALAKAFLLNFRDIPNGVRPERLIAEFSQLQGYQQVEHVVLHPSVPPEPQLGNVVGNLSCSVAISQALLELIYSGHYMADGPWTRPNLQQGWTTVVQRSGGHTGGWNFENLSYVLPQTVRVSPFWRLAGPDPITDPDIFSLQAGVDGADIEVTEALQDGVRCLRQELFRPAVTMLGKAMEGAWIELGLALAAALPSNTAGDREREKMDRYLRDENRGIARKIQDVSNLYQRRDLLANVISSSEVRPDDLGAVVIWSDVVRESRNAIHFGVRPTVADSYEKTVVLFLEGAKSLRTMYQIQRAATQGATAL